MNQRRILVVGSLNADLVQNIKRVPNPGETIEGSELQMFCGGKGANQACAAARLGGAVSMVGMVGADAFGSRLRSEIEAAGVHISGIGASAKSTGAATIFVLPSGENLIVLSPGANMDVSAPMAVKAIDDSTAGDLLLCQLEIPMDTVLAALLAARRRGMFAILDPAPAKPIPVAALVTVDLLTPNQSEAAAMLGWDGEIASMEDARKAAVMLLQKGPGSVIIKMGDLGCLVATEKFLIELAGHRVKAVDTTGAGDTFNGALAVALSEGADLVEAARFANGAAAFSVTLPGAIHSMPTRSALTSFLEDRSAATKVG